MAITAAVRHWLSEDFHSQLGATSNQILTDGDLDNAFENVLGFVFKLILSGNAGAANRVLEKLFRLALFTRDAHI